MPVAEKEIFLAVSRLLWAFKIQSLVPGETICLEEYEGNSWSYPIMPFKVNLIPRHEQVGSVLEAKDEIVSI